MQKRLIIQTYKELARLRNLLENAEQHRLRSIAANLRDRIAAVERQIRTYEWAGLNAAAA
jgi:hypothetical protein